MKVNYSNQNVIKNKKSIFLAGPTPRSVKVISWRNEAIKILKNLNYDGVVYVPELEHDNRTYDYNNQVYWERDALHNSNVIVFWIPRNIETLPAFTTNVEFGYWICKNSDKVLYGRPDDSVKNKYLDWLYEYETKRRPINNLEELLKQAIVLADKRKNMKDLDSQLID